MNFRKLKDNQNFSGCKQSTVFICLRIFEYLNLDEEEPAENSENKLSTENVQAVHLADTEINLAPAEG